MKNIEKIEINNKMILIKYSTELEKRTIEYLNDIIYCKLEGFEFNKNENLKSTVIEEFVNSDLKSGSYFIYKDKIKTFLKDCFNDLILVNDFLNENFDTNLIINSDNLNKTELTFIEILLTYFIMDIKIENQEVKEWRKF